MIWPFSSKKLRSKSYLCNQCGYDFHFFISLMSLKTPKRYCDNSSRVILDFSTLSGTNSQILPPKRYDEHPRHFFRGVPPRATATLSWPAAFPLFVDFIAFFTSVGWNAPMSNSLSFCLVSISCGCKQAVGTCRVFRWQAYPRVYTVFFSTDKNIKWSHAFSHLLSACHSHMAWVVVKSNFRRKRCSTELKGMASHALWKIKRLRRVISMSNPPYPQKSGHWRLVNRRLQFECPGRPWDKTDLGNMSLGTTLGLARF